MVKPRNPDPPDGVLLIARTRGRPSRRLRLDRATWATLARLVCADEALSAYTVAKILGSSRRTRFRSLEVEEIRGQLGRLLDLASFESSGETLQLPARVDTLCHRDGGMEPMIGYESVPVDELKLEAWQPQLRGFREFLADADSLKIRFRTNQS